ncbi:MAG: hypothetical protein NVS3B24_18030 [Candidatus Dormibacteria bacterium]
MKVKQGAQRGQTLLIFALAFIVILGFAGLAIDGSHDYLVHRNAQNASDAAALAATNIMSQQAAAFTGPPTTSNTSYVQAAHDLASTNGFPTTFGTACDSTAGGKFTTNWVDAGPCNALSFKHRVTVNVPPSTLVGLCSSQPFNCVEVVITERIQNFITGTLGVPITTSVTNATAYAKQGTPGTLFTGSGFQAVYLYERSTPFCGAAQCFDRVKPPAKAQLSCTGANNCPTFWADTGSSPTITGIDGKTNLSPPSDQVALFSQGDMVIKDPTTICDPYGPTPCTAGAAVGNLGYAVATGSQIYCNPQVGSATPTPCTSSGQPGLAGLAGNETFPPSSITYTPTVKLPTNDCAGLVLNGEPITASSFIGSPDPSCIPTATDQFTIFPGSYRFIVINHGRYGFESGIYDIYGTAPVTALSSGTASDGIDHGNESAADFDLCTTGTPNGCPGLTAGIWIGHGKLGFTPETPASGGKACTSGVALAGTQGGGGDATIVSGSSVSFHFGPSSAGFVSTNEALGVNLAGPGNGAQTGVQGAPLLFDMENSGVIHLDSAGATQTATKPKTKISNGFVGLVYQTMSATAGGVEINPGLTGSAGTPALSGQVLAYSMTTFGRPGTAVDFTSGFGNGSGGVLVPSTKAEAELVPPGGAGVSFGLRSPVQPANGTLTYPTSYEQFYMQYTDEWALDAYDTYVTINGGPPIFFSKGLWNPQPSSGSLLPPNGAGQLNPTDARPARVDPSQDTLGLYPTKVTTPTGTFDWIYQGTDSTLGQYYFETNGNWTWGHEKDIGTTLASPNNAEIDFTFPVPPGQTVNILLYMTDGDHCGDYVTVSTTFSNIGGGGPPAPPVPGGVQLMQ